MVRSAEEEAGYSVARCQNGHMLSTVRDDLCGALGAEDQLVNGERHVKPDGRTLCFTTGGDVQELNVSGSVVSYLGLSNIPNGRLDMQGDGNLVYYDGPDDSSPRWAFNSDSRIFLLHAHGFSARTSAPMPLSGQEQAAWAGVLSARRGGKTLPTAVQTALVAFFAEKLFRQT